MRKTAAAMVLAFVAGVPLAGQRGQPPCETVGTQTSRSALDLIGIARCWDDRWVFAEAEHALAAAIVAVESQISSAPDEITGGPVFVGGNIVAPAPANKVVGAYPEQAASRGIGGTVVVQVTLKADGSVGQAEVVDSIPELDAAALATVKKMRFARTLVAGKPIEVSLFVPARFGLADEITAGDWITLARSYLAHGHPAAAAQTLGLALELERRDQKQFGASVLRSMVPPAGGGPAAPPRRLTYVAPKYPAYALSARAQGMVIIEAMIDLTGHVGRARVLRSAPGLDAEALNAVRQWTYEPAVVDGKPVSIVLTVSVSFQVK